MKMDWQYNTQSRSWRLVVGSWLAVVERWAGGYDYYARIEAHVPHGAVIQALHVFPSRQAAQAWCVTTIAQQRQSQP